MLLLELAAALQIRPAEALDELGTVLREAGPRQDPRVLDQIPHVTDLYSQYPLAVLRVLVNFAADNTANREWLVAHVDAFWAALLGQHLQPLCPENAGVMLRAMLFLLQFVRAVPDDTLPVLVKALAEKGAVLWAFLYYSSLVAQNDVEALGDPVEFLAELAALPESRVHLTAHNFDTVTSGFALVCRTEDPDDYSLLCHSQLINTWTNVPDEPRPVPVDRILPLFEQIPPDVENAFHIKRNLFAACGNVYAYPSFDNAGHATRHAACITTKSDPNLIAACAVSLGNCVANEDSKQKTLDLLNRTSSVVDIAHKLLLLALGDIVLFQAYHFFNNLMTRELALAVLQNHEMVARNTKSVMDNQQYYPEIGRLYCKFLGRVITIAFLEPKADPLPYEDIWIPALQSDSNVLLLLLEAYCQAAQPLEFEKTLVLNVLDLPESIDAVLLLARLKALAVLCKARDALVWQQLYGPETLTSLTKFLHGVQASASAEGDAQHHALSSAVSNNTKFVAVAALQIAESLAPSFSTETTAVTAVCAELIRSQ